MNQTKNMEKEIKNSDSISLALKEAAVSNERTIAARLRDRLDEIEEALKAGVKRKVIYQILRKNGFEDVTFEVFAVTLHNIRKDKNKVRRAIKNPLATLAVQSQAKTCSSNSNPLSSLSSKPKPGEFNPIPTAKIEIED